MESCLFATEKICPFVQKQITIFLDQFSNVPIIWISLSIVIVIFISYLAFEVFLLSSIDYENLSKYFEELNKIKDDSKKSKYYKHLICSYSILNGIVATAVAYIQFNAVPNIPTAVIYGVVGPYILREKLYSSFGTHFEQMTQKMLEDKNKDRTEEFKEFVGKLGRKDKTTS